MQITMTELTYSNILGASPIVTSVVDAEGAVVYVNDAFLRHASKVLGKEIRREDRIGTNVLEFARYDREEWQERYRRVLKEGETLLLEEVRSRLPDREIYMDTQMSPIKERDGKVIGAVITRQDVTDRVRRQREDRRRTALDRVRVSVYEMRETADIQKVLVSLDGALKDVGMEFDGSSVSIVDEGKVSREAYSIAPDGVGPVLGAPLVGTAVYKAWREKRPVYRRDLDREDRYNEKAEISAGSGKPIRSVVDVPFSHGTIAINSMRPDAFSKREIELLEGFAEVLSEGYTRLADLERTSEAEKRLREERDTAQSYLDIAGVMIVALDVKGKVTLVNQKACEVLGYEEEKIVGRNWFHHFLPERLREDVRGVSEKLLAGEIEPAEYYENPVLTRSGEERIIAWHNTALRDEAGDIIGHLSSGEDITERKRAEKSLEEYSERLAEMVEERTRELQDAQEQLVRQGKLAVLGQLAGGVGHELRNPLGVITNAIYFLNMTLPDADETTREYLEMISSEIRNAEKIVSDLLDFSRVKSVEREETEVSELVAGVLVQHPPPEGVEVSTEIPSDLPSAFVDGRQMGQVLSNLLLNAYQAMSEGGCVRITADEIGVDDTIRNPQSAIRIRISDTGCGISSEDLKRIFEPLVTTKARGIGLGLSVSRNLMEGNGGSIEVESEEGKGSTFTVILPVRDASPLGDT